VPVEAAKAEIADRISYSPHWPARELLCISPCRHLISTIRSTMASEDKNKVREPLREETERWDTHY
jgi:hypothetical protein